MDTGKDLNAYAKVENQSACCSPAAASASDLGVVDSCCGPAAADLSAVHEGLSALLSRYNVNDYAASVHVYAVKDRGTP